MYSLYLLKEHIYNRDFILNNADLVIDEQLVSKLINDERANLVAVDKGKYINESMKVSVDVSGKIDNISKLLDKKCSYGCSIDFYKFSSESSSIFFDKICNIIEGEGNIRDWTEVAMQKLFYNGLLEFYPFNVDGMPWVEVDNYDDLLLADQIFSQQNKKICEYQVFCLDLDGTVFIGENPIPGVADKINELKSLGKTVRFLSNNSSKCKSEYVELLCSFGISCSEEDIFISSDSAISYLKKLNVKKVYVLGTPSLETYVRECGIEICEDSPEFILVGYDTTLTYSKLVKASNLINKGIDFIATHSDRVCPTPYGPVPDVGLITDILEKTTGNNVYKVFGKPSKEMIDNIINNESVNIDDIIMVGDRLYTDIQMASDAKISSLLVLSGETKRDELEYSSVLPTYILKDLSYIDC